MVKKKNFWRGLGIGAIFVLAFFAVQGVVTVVVEYTMLGIELIKSPESIEVLGDMNSLMQSDILSKVVTMSTIISEAIFILIVFIYFWCRKKNPLKELEINPVSPLTMLLSLITGVALCFFVELVLDQFIPQSMFDTYDGVFSIVYNAPALLVTLSVGIIAPICEEVVFRGCLMNSIRRESNAAAAIIISGLIFGLIHGIPLQMLYASFVGIILGLVFHLTKSIVPTIIIHIANNILSDYTGYFLEYMSKYPIIFIIVTGLICVICIVLMGLIEKKRKYSVEFDSALKLEA